MRCVWEVDFVMSNSSLRSLGLGALSLLVLNSLSCQRRAEEPAPASRPAAARPTATSSPPSRPAETLGWRKLEEGLELGVFDLPRKSIAGDSRVRILRIDPAYFAFKLMNASAPGQDKPLSARRWCERAGLTAAVNASMFQKDGLSSVAFMKTTGHANNSVANNDKAALCFDPASAGRPSAQIADLEKQTLADLCKNYGSVIQDIRMISPAGANVWSQQPKAWSTTAIGQDKHGRMLFIHCRSPYSVHDLIDMLLGLPIDLKAAMYTEGGPEAQMFVRSGNFEMEAVGSYETGFVENDSNTLAWPVPNVVGIARIRQ